MGNEVSDAQHWRPHFSQDRAMSPEAERECRRLGRAAAGDWTYHLLTKKSRGQLWEPKKAKPGSIPETQDVGECFSARVVFFRNNADRIM